MIRDSQFIPLKDHAGHGPSYVEAFTRIFRQWLFDELERSPFLTVAEVYGKTSLRFRQAVSQDEVPITNGEVTLLLGNLKSHSSAMDRWRLKETPTQPKTIQDIANRFNTPQYSEYEDFIYSGPSNPQFNRFIIFNGFTNKNKLLVLLIISHRQEIVDHEVVCLVSSESYDESTSVLFSINPLTFSFYFQFS